MDVRWRPGSRRMVWTWVGWRMVASCRSGARPGRRAQRREGTSGRRAISSPGPSAPRTSSAPAPAGAAI